MLSASNWFFWAFLSAVFAALTAIFAKVGVEGMHPDLATFVRTLVIMGVVSGILHFTGNWSNPLTLSSKTLFFLVLSGLATGASWICYFRALKIGEASQVAPVDKLSVLFVALFGSVFLNERLSIREWVGIVLVAGGVLLLALKR